MQTRLTYVYANTYNNELPTQVWVQMCSVLKSEIDAFEAIFWGRIKLLVDIIVQDIICHASNNSRFSY